MHLADRDTIAATSGTSWDAAHLEARATATPKPATHRLDQSARHAIEHFVATTRSGAIIDMQPITTGYEDLNVIVTTATERLVVKVFDRGRSAADCERYIDNIERAIECGVRHPPLRRSSDDGRRLLSFDATCQPMRGCVIDFVAAPSLYERGDVLDTAEQNDLMRQVALLATDSSARDTSSAERWDQRDPWSALQLHRHLGQDDLPTGPVRDLATTIESSFDLNAIARLPVGFVHADLVPTNLICPGDGTVVVIDFGRAGVLPRIHELAVLAAYTLAFNDVDHGQRDHLGHIDHMVDMYEQHHPLTSEEREILPTYIAAVGAACMVTAELERLAGNATLENSYWLQRGIRVGTAAIGLIVPSRTGHA